MFYEEIYQPRVFDYDRDGKLSYEAILQILETAGSHHSDHAGDNVIDGSQNGVAWILTEWRVQVLRRTDSKEALHVTTWVHGKAGKAPASMVFRNFILTDGNGNEVIRAEAKFALLDLESGKLTRINEELFASYQPEDKSVFDTSAPRLRAPMAFNSEKIITLRRSDIDFNGHVHNTRYMDFALEALPCSNYANKNICEFRIVYMKPIKESATVIVKRSDDNNRYSICVYSNDMLCTLCEFEESM